MNFLMNYIIFVLLVDESFESIFNKVYGNCL